MEQPKKKDKMVSIGMWPEKNRYMLNLIVSHRSAINMQKFTARKVLGELVEKEYKRISRGNNGRD
jgi:hypothetical protein